MRFRLFALGAALTLPLALNAQTTTYDYTGSNFSYFNMNGGVASFTPQPGSPYTTGDSVTGTFTITGNIDSLSSKYFTPDSFSFTDGVQTISSANGGDFFGLLTTDATGDITSYVIEVSNPTVANDWISINVVPAGSTPADFGKFLDPNGNVYDAGNGVNGSFSAPMPAAATPEPGSLALMGTGALGLLAEMRRRLRRA